MSRKLAGLMLILSVVGCAGNRPGWGFPWGQGSSDRQKARAVVHDPYTLNDIGPEVSGGRPREFADPQAEAKRANVTESFPRGFSFGPQN